MKNLGYDLLKQAVTGTAAGFRCVTRLPTWISSSSRKRTNGLLRQVSPMRRCRSAGSSSSGGARRRAHIAPPTKSSLLDVRISRE